MKIFLASRPEYPDQLPRKELKTETECDTDSKNKPKRLTVGLSYPGISACAVIESPDRLTPLGDSDTDRHEYHIYLGNNSNTGQRYICSVHGRRSIMPQRIIHSDLDRRHGDLVDTGRHAEGRDCS